MADQVLSSSPSRVSISARDIGKQVSRDLFDKEVASAATYSYLWIADQMGHIGLGIVVVFAASWIFASVDWYLTAHGHAALNDRFWPLWLGLFLVSFWELRAYRAYAALSKELFAPDNALLAKNAMIAAFYMVAGVLAGFVWQDGSKLEAALVTLALVPLLVFLAIPWLRQKITWQKAGLPFLFRLTYFTKTVSPAAAKALQEVLTEQIAGQARNQIVILSGPLGAGKTSMACGIGTESAFGGVKVRYATFDKLAQMAVDRKDDPGPDNIKYWPWLESELLIIDDINSGVPDNHYLPLEEFKKIIRDDFKEAALWLGKRTTVWIIGPKSPEGLTAWSTAIAEICAKGSGGVPKVTVVEFSAPQAPKSDAG